MNPTDKDYEKAQIEFAKFVSQNPCFFQLYFLRNSLHTGYTSEPNVAVYREGQRQCVQILQEIAQDGQEIINNKIKGVSDGNINAPSR